MNSQKKTKDPKFRAVIVTGDESAFCGGADITAAASEDGMGWESVEQALNEAIMLLKQFDLYG